MKCKKCGKENDTDAKFCDNCGNKLEAEEQNENTTTNEKTSEEHKNIENQENQDFRQEEPTKSEQDNVESVNTNIDSMNPNTRQKKNNAVIIIIIVAAALIVPIIIIITLLLTGVIAYKSFNNKPSTPTPIVDKKDDEEKNDNKKTDVNNKDDEKKSSEETKNNDSISTNEEQTTPVRTLYFYKYNDVETYVANITQSQPNNSTYVNKYECSNYCEYERLEYNYDSFLIRDKKNYVYNAKTGKTIEIKYEGVFTRADLAVDVDNNVKGIIINKNIYYDVAKEKVTYETKYAFDVNEISGFISKGVIPVSYASCGTRILMNINTWKEVENSKVENKKYFSYGNLNYISEGCEDYYNRINLLDDSFKPLFDEYRFNVTTTRDNKVISFDYKSDHYSIYDINTKKVKNGLKPGYEIITIIDKFIIVNKNGKVAILDLNHKVLKEMEEDSSKLAIEPSGYYKSHSNKPKGMYLIIENGDDNCYEYYYDESKNELIKYEMEVCGGYAKPVLYLYPTKTTKVTINFAHEDMLTTTYPKFNGNWKVTAKPNGDLYDAKGNYYYALYWEEQKNHIVDFKEGFYVEKENAIEFLEEKLNIIGLNAKERNEFIMYWLPILEKNDKSLVYFELTEERDSYNKLIISPKPDSILRVAMHVKKVNGKTNIKEQKLNTFKRKGFTAVEWGGILY